jgi:iron complex transport system permease protein
MAGLLGLLAVVIGVACSIGTASIPFADVWKVLLSQIPFVNLDGGISGTVSTIVVDYRLPRILLAGLVGASLSTAGATYQGLFRNPLADPYLLGVAQGAGLGAVIGFMLPFSSTAVIGTIPLMALCGGSFVIVILYLLARVGKTLPMTTLILAGVAMGSFLFAITSFLLTQSGDKLHGILFWLMGSFTNSQWNEVYVLAPYLLVSIIPIYLYSRPLNLIQMDEDQAKQLGVNVEKVKIILLLTATLITAAAVSFAGCIGFVGIIIPHAVRLIWGPDYRFLLPLSTIVGAIFLILTDTLARTATGTAQEIPVGVITALIGAPFFLYLLRQKKRVFF